ncbi:hypothetical protein M9H77_31073 [Catharanthus roseus]|uniref:Uncharacterized protein n=1 Tax=Catharanthus roseus TaxID=4058 RepID=A0ACC0A002_CATRO|nr:hypothetical protein M9H77_31073 [Catharanthus roseus]
MEVKLGPMTRGQRKKFKHQEDNGMLASYMMEALKSKGDEFEDEEKHPKLFTMCTIIKEQSRNQLGVKMATCWRRATLPSMIILPLPSLVGFWSGVSWKTTPYRIQEFLFLNSINPRSSSLCSWGFEAIVSSRFFLSN